MQLILTCMIGYYIGFEIIRFVVTKLFKLAWFLVMLPIKIIF